MADDFIQHSSAGRPVSAPSGSTLLEPSCALPDGDLREDVWPLERTAFPLRGHYRPPLPSAGRAELLLRRLRWAQRLVRLFRRSDRAVYSRLTHSRLATFFLAPPQHRICSSQR